MSILNKTSNMELTQFSGDILMFSNIYSVYNSDMQKIDDYCSGIETRVDARLTAMETDIGEFEDRVTADFTALDTKVDGYESRIATLESCCEDVNVTLLNYGSRLIDIERVIDTVSTANIDDLTERVNALENKVETNTTNIGMLRDELHELEDRVTEDESVIYQHESTLTNHDGRITTLENCCSEVRTTLAEYDGRITNNTTEINNLKDRLTHDEENIAANAQDITILSGQVAVNTADIEELKDGLAELDPASTLGVVRQVSVNAINIANLQSSVSAQATNLTALSTRVTNDETVISRHTGEITQLQQDIQQVQSWEDRISTVEADTEELKEDVEAVETTVTNFSDTIADIQSDISDLQTEDTGIKNRVSALESAVATDESNFVALQNRVSANEADLALIHQTITDDEAELSDLDGRVTDLETQNGDTPLTTTNQTLSSAVNEVNTKVVNADSKATQALGKADALEATIGDVSSGLVKDVDDLQSDKADKVSSATNRNLAMLNTSGNLVDSGISKDIFPTNASSANILVTQANVLSMTGCVVGKLRAGQRIRVILDNEFSGFYGLLQVAGQALRTFKVANAKRALTAGVFVDKEVAINGTNYWVDEYHGLINGSTYSMGALVFSCPADREIEIRNTGSETESFWLGGNIVGSTIV